MRLRLAIVILALAFSGVSSLAEDRPYRVSLVGDAFDGKAWHTGVLIELDPGWKTYWRMPGESGVAPEFTWTTSVPADVTVAYPAPTRHTDQSGDAVGYFGEVLFPVTVKAWKASAVTLKLDLFFGVCKDVCIPARAEASIGLGTLARDPRGSARVEEAAKAVPVAGTAVTSARTVEEGGRPVLLLSLSEKADDIFVETDSSAYFRAPQFSGNSREARLAIDGLGDASKLKGAALKLTYIIGGTGHEQTVTLP